MIQEKALARAIAGTGDTVDFSGYGKMNSNRQ